MNEETEYIKTLLPDSYKCEPRFNGVFCYCTKGVGISEEDVWYNFNHALRTKYGKRFKDIYHTDLMPPTRSEFHMQFMVHIKP